MTQSNQRSDLLGLYRSLVLARGAEEQIRKDYFKDEMKTPVHLGIGSEGIGCGVIHALPKSTKVFGTYRNHNIYLSLSDDTDSFFGELFGRVTGCARGKAGSMHMSSPEHGLVLTSAVVGTTIPVAVGAALSNWYQGKDEVVAVFFGDGAIEEGVFWESLNFAVLRKLKVLFICEDNELAIHTPKRDRQGFKLGDSVLGFGGHYLEGNGRFPEQVVSTTKEMLSKMAAQPGPGVLKFDYFRFLQHVGPLGDFDAGYRQKPADLEIAQDPVLNYERYLLRSGCAQADLDQIKSEVEKKIFASVERARVAPFADASELCKDVYFEDQKGPEGNVR